MSPLEAENVNHLWSRLLFEEWRRQGLRRVIICPGSRSSPLAVAAARTSGLETLVVIDERCAGFIALGAAKAEGAPCAVVTTSGTAVANLLPAAVEAQQSGTPILFVTADRPFELRACGANQTIEQRGIFGAHVRWSMELPAPTTAIDPEVILSAADEAWARATMPPAGGVHVNAPFREPLDLRRGELPAFGERLREWAARDQPWRREVAHACAARGEDLFEGAERPLVIAGAGRGDAAIVADALEAPLLADVTAAAGGIRSADLVLQALADERCAALRDRLRPDLVLRLGGALAGKRVNEFASTCDRLIVERSTERFDDRHRAGAAVPQGWRPGSQRRGNPAFRELWRQAGEAAAEAIEKHFASLSEDAPASEPYIAHELQRHAREGFLVAAGSMPIRDVDAFRPRDARVERVLANRGASGIDGLVSTAVGASLGGRPVTLLLGDLALLHDLGGLANLRAAPQPLHVVVINNDGGGIFHFLPIASDASAEPYFERLFGTPHGFSFAGAAAMFGLQYARVAKAGEARRAFAALAQADKPHLVECVTDRRANVSIHRAAQRAVADALAERFA